MPFLFLFFLDVSPTRHRDLHVRESQNKNKKALHLVFLCIWTYIFCLSLSFLENVGRSANEVRSFEFLRKEIPVRLANIMQEINLLPQNLLRMPSVHLVHNWYVKSFKEILEFEDIKSVDNNKLNELVTISLDLL